MLALEFVVDGINYLIDATFVDSIMLPPRETAFIPRHDDKKVELFSFRGEITPLINFNMLLGNEQRGKDNVMTFFIDNRFFAFYISDIGSVLNIDDDEIHPHNHPTSCMRGMYESPSKKLYTVVDTLKFTDLIRKSAR